VNLTLHRNTVYIPLLLMLYALALPCVVHATSFSGPVVSVLEGDTIEVLHNDRPERIRLSGIDCRRKVRLTAREPSKLPQS